MTILTEEQKVSFIREGYLILPQIVSMSLIQAALNHCDAAYAARHYNVPKGSSYETATPSFWGPVKSAPAVTDLFFKSGLLEVAEQLFGARNVDLMNNDAQIAYTLPNAQCGLGVDEPHPRHKWHIDTPLGDYIARGADFTLIVGVALSEGQEIDENRGQFVVWPGSHLITHATMREVIQTEAPGQVIAAFKSRKPDVGEGKRVLVRRGDAFLAHQRAAHAPGANAYRQVRKNIYFRVRHRRHDELLHAFSRAPAPWVGFEALTQLVDRARAPSRSALSAVERGAPAATPGDDL